MNNVTPNDDQLNALASKVGVPASRSVNALSNLPGAREDVKAYLGLMGFDPSTMTEQMLSPRAVAEMRQTIAQTLAKKSNDDWAIINSYPDTPGNTHMKHVIGRVAPSNLRQVNIGGVPYYQLLDRYDFDAGAKYDGTWQNALASGAGDFVRDPMGSLNMGKDDAKGYLNYPFEAERFAGKLGLGRNVNYLIPVDPNRQAHPKDVEVYRQKTNLPFPSQTLGTKVVNALNPWGTPDPQPQPPQRQYLQ